MSIRLRLNLGDYRRAKAEKRLKIARLISRQVERVADDLHRVTQVGNVFIRSIPLPNICQDSYTRAARRKIEQIAEQCRLDSTFD
jgi:hypothetical protein